MMQVDSWLHYLRFVYRTFVWINLLYTFHFYILQVLLGLTDEDLELGLGVSSLMHRRKLRLAIEDYRDAENGSGWGEDADNPSNY